jgi:hypothetical protein
LVEWNDADLAEMLNIARVAGQGLPADLAIAYGVDLRQALTNYRFKGYRHAMIEVGLAAQACRQALADVGQECGEPLGERNWSAFADLHSEVADVTGLPTCATRRRCSVTAGPCKNHSDVGLLRVVT